MFKADLKVFMRNYDHTWLQVILCASQISVLQKRHSIRNKLSLSVIVPAWPSTIKEIINCKACIRFSLLAKNYIIEQMLFFRILFPTTANHQCVPNSCVGPTTKKCFICIRAAFFASTFKPRETPRHRHICPAKPRKWFSNLRAEVNIFQTRNLSPKTTWRPIVTAATVGNLTTALPVLLILAVAGVQTQGTFNCVSLNLYQECHIVAAS